MIPISIVMPFYNDEAYLKEAIQAILNQSVKDFELILVDDHSGSKATAIAKTFKDHRIRYVRNSKNLNITKSRNRGLRLARGRIVFSTDSDCVTDRHWLREGIKSFTDKSIVGVEGPVYYVAPGYKPTLADKVPGTLENTQGHYMIGNMAYLNAIIKELSYLDTSFLYNEDREFGLRAIQNGRIVYQPGMIVTHQRKLWTVAAFIKAPSRARNRVIFFKRFGERHFMLGRILFPLNYLKLLIPPLAIAKPILDGRVRTWQDIKLLPFLWLRLFYERYIIWKTAIKERVFVI